MLAMKGVPVAEFNMEETPRTGEFRYINNASFSVKCNGKILKWQTNCQGGFRNHLFLHVK